MNSQQTEDFRRRLLTWRSQLLDETEGSIRHSYKISGAQFDAMSSAANLTEQNVQHQSSDQRSRLLGKINMALDRIEAGAYGMGQGLVN